MNKHFVSMSAAEYQSQYGNKKLPLPKDFMQLKGVSIKGRPPVNENPVQDGIEECHDSESVAWTKITLVGLSPGLNGKDGLIRQHWAAAGKLRDSYVARIKALKPCAYAGPVQVTYTRFTSSLMDWDNAGSAFKKIGDALVIAGVLTDDSPEVIREFLPKQEKVRRKDQRMEILINKL